jgi:hypothetical protein
MSTPPTFPIATLEVRAWPDVVIDEVGHDVHSAYVERFWLGVLGPSATWLLRRLVAGLEADPDGFELDLALAASELGLGGRSGRHSPFFRTIERCGRFGATQLVGDHTIRVRRKLPPLTRLQIARLPEPVQRAHQSWQDVPPPADVPVEQLKERARGLALSLLELGEAPEATERQLHRWRLHPAIAHEAVGWARRHRSVSGAVPHDDVPPEAA